MRCAGKLGVVLVVTACVFTAAGCAGSPTGSSDLCSTPPKTLAQATDDHVLAFTSDRTGSLDLWLVGSDGGDPVQLTDDPGVEGMASWSPDGTRLLFVASRDLESNGDICVINADGTGLENLTETPDVYETTPAWAPDGSHIVYGIWDKNDHALHIMEADGSSSTELTSNGNWPSWSPDGERLVYAASQGRQEQDLWTIRRDGSEVSRLADGKTELTEPAWSPDGRMIAFVSIADGETEEDIFLMSADGGKAMRLTTAEGDDHWPPAWSPDNTRLAFTADGAKGVGDIVVIDVNTRETTNLTRHKANDAFPAWRSGPK